MPTNPDMLESSFLSSAAISPFQEEMRATYCGVNASIFALTDKELEARLVEFRKKQTEVVLAAEL